MEIKLKNNYVMETWSTILEGQWYDFHLLTAEKAVESWDNHACGIEFWLLMSQN